METELSSLEKALNALHSAVEHHRSISPRGRPFPATIRKQAVDLLNDGCSASQIKKKCRLRFAQLNNWRQQPGGHSGNRKVIRDAEPVSVKVLEVEGAANAKSMEKEISSLCLTGNIEGLPFMLSLGQRLSQGR